MGHFLLEQCQLIWRYLGIFLLRFGLLIALAPLFRGSGLVSVRFLFELFTQQGSRRLCLFTLSVAALPFLAKQINEAVQDSEVAVYRIATRDCIGVSVVGMVFAH